MINNATQIYAIGGGGFSHLHKESKNDLVLEEYLLGLVPKNPKIGYIGHANNDDILRIERFYRRFSGVAKTCHLKVEAFPEEVSNFFFDIDILYVGGGSTKRLLNYWFQIDIVKSIESSVENGLILAGVSAGAMCWFDQVVTGSSTEGYELMTGMGIVRGALCPHFNSEPKRKEIFQNYILKNKVPFGIAIEEGVAVHISGNKIVEIINARNGAAYIITSSGNVLEVSILKSGDRLP